MKRIVELEIRLAYFERVQQTLPEEIQAVAMPKQEPTATFTYADESHPYSAQAGRLINSIKAKASADVILADFETFKSSIVDDASSAIPTEATEGMVANATQADVVVRDLTIQCVLQVGSRSFSHFLNIVERYHSLLRQLSRSGRMRAAILAGAVRFWSASQQWVHIVVDKLLQYRIVEPADVVEFIFSPPADEPRTIQPVSGLAGEGWCGFNTWTLLRLTLEKVNGRVDQLKKRLEEIQRKEAEETERKEAAAAAGLPFEGPRRSACRRESRTALPDERNTPHPTRTRGQVGRTILRRSARQPRRDQERTAKGAHPHRQRVQTPPPVASSGEGEEIGASGGSPRGTSSL